MRRRPAPARLDASSATRSRWRRACPASSSPATCAPTRSSGSPPPSARARWPSPWSTATWGRPVTVIELGRHADPGRAARAVPLRDASTTSSSTGSPSTAGSRESRPASVVFGEGEPAEASRPAAPGTISMTRQVGPDEVEIDPHRPASASTPARCSPTWTTASSRRTPRSLRAVTDARFSCCPPTTSAPRCRDWFPMAMHLLEGLFLGHAQLASRSSASASSCWRWAR